MSMWLSGSDRHGLERRRTSQNRLSPDFPAGRGCRVTCVARCDLGPDPVLRSAAAAGATWMKRRPNGSSAIRMGAKLDAARKRTRIVVAEAPAANLARRSVHTSEESGEMCRCRPGRAGHPETMTGRGWKTGKCSLTWQQCGNLLGAVICEP